MWSDVIAWKIWATRWPERCRRRRKKGWNVNNFLKRRFPEPTAIISWISKHQRSFCTGGFLRYMSCNSGNISEDNIKCMSTGTFRNFFLNTEAGTWQRILPMPCETSSFGAVAATEGANPPPKLRSYWGLLLWKDEKKSRALKEILEFMILSRQVMETIWNSIKIQHSSKRPEAFLVSPYRWFVQMGLAGHSPSPGE